MRHVLIICYDFPDIHNAGVIRTYQFARRLPEFGWHPIILTAQPCGKKRWDVAADIEFSDGNLACPKFTAPPWRVPLPVRVRHGSERTSPRRTVRNTNDLMHRLSRFASGFAVPDGKVGWFYPAVRRGVQIARAYGYQACFSVSPRPTAHLVAYRLSRRLDIPWVADFALPWSDAYWLAGRPRLIGRLDRKLERLVVRSAQQVTVAYAELARSLGERHNTGKISVIPTGAEEELFSATGPLPARKFTIIYPGNHFCEPGRHGELFLQAIDDWIATDPALERKVEFIFIGKRDEDLLRCRRAMANPKVIRVEPLVSHRSCIEAIQSAHACVVNTVGNRIPAKVYECMRAGKPILALADAGSDLDAAIRGYSKGVGVRPDDRDAILRALKQLCAEEFPATAEDGRWLAQHDAARSARLLARVLDRVLRPDS